MKKMWEPWINLMSNHKTKKQKLLWKQVGKFSGTLLLSGMLAVTTFPTWGPLDVDLQRVSAQSVKSVQIANAKAKNGQQEMPSIEVVSETPITAGAILREYVWKSTRSGKEASAIARVIEIDLQQPYVNLDVITGQGGQFTKRSTVRRMANEASAVGGINGDFYSMNAEGAPMGPQVTSGQIVSSPSQLNGMYAFGLTADRKPIIERFQFSGTVRAADGTTFPLAGMNKTYYYTEPERTHSHVDAMYIYTSMWGSEQRANDGSTTPTEVLVIDGIVTQISEGEPLPMTPPQNGYILRANRSAAQFILNHVRVGDPIEVDYELIPVNPKKTFDANALQMLIGGHTLLVDDGKPANYTRDVTSIGGYRARTGIGYSQDGRFVYLITVDRSGNSQGMSLGEFREFMTMIGVWRGLNLDGGGSTQIVSRPLGETNVQLVNHPEGGSERHVVNGVGVFTSAPPGKLLDMIPTGKNILFIGESSPYELKAYDEYYNPMDVQQLIVHWAVAHDLGTFEGNVFTAKKPGFTEVIAQADAIKRSLEVEVVGFDHIEQMNVSTAASVLKPGELIDIKADIITKSGFKRQVPVELLNWEFRGFHGGFKDGQILVNRVTSPDGVGHIIMRYDGFSNVVALSSAGVEEEWLTFDEYQPAVRFNGYPAGVEGNALIVNGLPAKSADDHALVIQYDFTNGTGTRAAYAVFNDGEGEAVPGSPFAMKLDIMGDGSRNWLRAEIVDANGEKHLVDLTRNLDWHGWETVEVDLQRYNMQFPVRLARIYVANPEQGQENRALTGQVAVDHISFIYPGIKDEVKSEVKLTVGKPSIVIDGEESPLDQPAVIVDGSTLVPLRFITSALGGSVGWDNTTKQMTLLRDDQLIDMWIGNPEFILNGKRYETTIEPRILNGRTMVPLRLISENFGWEVHWDHETKTVQLKG